MDNEQSGAEDRADCGDKHTIGRLTAVCTRPDGHDGLHANGLYSWVGGHDDR